MISRYMRSYLFLIVVLIKVPCQCMEVVQHSVDSDLPYIPLDLFKKFEPHLPTKTLQALACTTRDIRKEFEDPYWLKVFNLREARRTTPGTLKYNKVNKTLIHLAQASTAHHYDQAHYEILLKDPYFDANFISTYGDTVLMHASKRFCISLIQSLINNRANPNLYIGPNENSPLSHTIVAPYFFEKPTPEFFRNQNKTIECLTQLGADINHSTLHSQENYLFRAINLHILSVIPTLLAYGINPNHKRNDGMTPLGVIVGSALAPDIKFYTTVVALMQAGANPYERFRNDHESSILEIYNWKYPALTFLIEDNLKGDADWYKANTPKF
jgi:hypothetical protein